MSEPTDPSAGIALLRQHLGELAAKGEERVWLSDEALEQLSTLPAKLRRAPATTASAASPAAAPQAASAAPPQTAPVASQPESPPANAAPTPVVREQTPPAQSAPPTQQPTGDKRAQITAVRKRAEQCTRCKELGSLRETIVFASGNPDADLMLVGEAPGSEEEQQGKPFVGPAGQLLTKILQAMGLTRKAVYISNIVKFRPSTGAADQGTANRKPTAEEMAASIEYIREEVAIVQPKLIVALGGTAMEGLLGLDGSVGAARGRMHDFSGTPAIVTYHPSYLLRTGAITDKRKVWEDMLVAMEHLQMPITEKHRGYFL